MEQTPICSDWYLVSRQNFTLLRSALTWYVYYRVTSQYLVEEGDIILGLKFMYVHRKSNWSLDPA